MDQNTNIETLKKITQNFCEERNWDQFHNPKDLAIGASTEANELLELFRFVNEKEVLQKIQVPEFKEKVQQELSDVFFFVLRFAQLYKIDLSTAFVSKMQRNAEKYPVEKARDSNKKYNE